MIGIYALIPIKTLKSLSLRANVRVRQMFPHLVTHSTGRDQREVESIKTIKMRLRFGGAFFVVGRQ